MDPSPTPIKPKIQIMDVDPSKTSSMGMVVANPVSVSANPNSGSNNTSSMTTTKEDSGGGGGDNITNDDLQAMKDMIGDIKKDPSLLYRLSSLPGGNANTNTVAAPAPAAAMSSSRNNSTSGKIFVDDDATDVSSLGMMSSSEYNPNNSYQNNHLSSHHNHNHPQYNGAGGDTNNNTKYNNNNNQGGATPGGNMSMSPGLNKMNNKNIKHKGNQIQSSASFANATSANAVSVRRTNHDAEIALRMQSLRAKRGLLTSHQGSSQSRLLNTHPGQNNHHGHGHSPMRISPGSAGMMVPSAAAPMTVVAPRMGGVNSAPVPQRRNTAPPISAARGGGPAVGGNNNNERITIADSISTTLPFNNTGQQQQQQQQRKSDPTNSMLSRQQIQQQQQQRQQTASSDLDRKIRKKLEGRRSSSTDIGNSAQHQNKPNLVKSKKSSTRKDNNDDDDGDDSETSDNSVALVLYQEEDENQRQQNQQAQQIQQQQQQQISQKASSEHRDTSEGALTVSGSDDEYRNYAMQLSSSSDNQQVVASSPAAQYYHSAISKYATAGGGNDNNNNNNNNNERSSNNSSRSATATATNNGPSGEIPSNGQRQRSNSQRSSSSGHSRSKVEGKSRLARRDSQESGSSTSNASLSSRASKNSKRSRSELPRQRKGFNGSNEGGTRSSSEVRSSHRQSQQRNRQHYANDNNNNNTQGGDPPSSSQSGVAHMDRESLIANLRAEQKSSRSVMVSKDGTTSHVVEHAEPSSTGRLGRNGGLKKAQSFVHHPPTTSSLKRSTTTPVQEENDTQHASNGHGNEQEESLHPPPLPASFGNPPTSSQKEPPPPPVAASSSFVHYPPSSNPPSLSQGLAHLANKDGRYPRRRPSVESESGKSVISRLSQLQRRVKNKNPSKRSVSSQDNTGQGSGSLYSGAFSSDNDHDYNSKGLVSRIASHSFAGNSPKALTRRRLTSDDFNGSEQLLSTSEGHYIANDGETDHVTMGIELAIRSGQVPRICDERGRCLFHPNIRLQKPKIFGGWKVLFQHCPDCAVEHMKKTQETLASMKLQKEAEREQRELEMQQQQKEQQRSEKKSREKSKKSKHRSKGKERDKHKADPIIGKNVGDEDFAAQHDKVKKKSHHHRKKEKEKHRAERHQKGERRNNEEPIETTPPTSSEDIPEETSNPPQQLQEQAFERPHGEGKESTGNNNYDEYNNHRDPPSQQQYRPQHIAEQQQLPQTPATEADQSSSSLAIVDYKQGEIQPKPSKPKPKRVNGLPWSDYNGRSGRYTGEVNAEFLPHGRGEMVYDRGIISAGIWYNGVLDTEEDASLGRGSSMNDSIVSHGSYSNDMLPNYAMGDKGREDDMIIDSKKATALAVGQIRINDAAFVRRSDGSWTYALVKDKTHDRDGNATIRFKVNVRGSTKAFPTSQWGTYVRRIKRRPEPPGGSSTSSAGTGSSRHASLGDFLDSKKSSTNARAGLSSSVSGNMMRRGADGASSVSSARSAPIMNGQSNARHRQLSADNHLTTGKMKIRSRSRSRSRNRKNVTTLPLLFSSSMSVSEENCEDGGAIMNDDWETASGSGYRLRGIDP